ncbi:hypothetical protein L7F22_035893 [Adiantum nelumboides]|nr:hypothetical protein [Adiantum nelumboides]
MFDNISIMPQFLIARGHNHHWPLLQQESQNQQEAVTLVRDYCKDQVRAHLEDKAETFTQALVNEVLVSHLEDLDNAEDDEEEEDEDKDDQAGTSGHLGPNDDNDDDQDQLGTDPSSGGATTDQPPASQPEPLVSKEVLGVGSSEPANVPMLTAEVEFLADVVKEKEMQHNLLQEMLHRVEVGRRAYICPPPPSVMSPTLDNFTLPAKCAGCGYGHNVNKALMLVVLSCKHTYHSVCFATMCAFTDQCMVQYCSMAIPRDAQSTVIWGDANMSCASSGRSKVFSRVKTEDKPSLERLQVVRNEGIGGEDHGSTVDIVNLKLAAASVDVPITATKVMIGIEWLENKVQDLSAANAEEEKVEEEEAEGDIVEEEAEQHELVDANKDIAEVLEDWSSQGFSSAELDLGDDSPLGHFHKVLASRKGRVHLGSRSSPAKKWKPSAGGCMLVMWVPCHLYIAVDCSAEAEMHVVWMSKIYCLFVATPHPQQFLDWLVSGYRLEIADFWLVFISGYWLVLSLVTGSVIRGETVVQQICSLVRDSSSGSDFCNFRVLDWLAVQDL